MRITCLPASVAVFALTLAACQPQPSPTPAATPEAAPSALPEADAAALRALLDRWQQAARAKDWPAVAATYTEDGMFMPPNGPSVRGRAAIEAWFKASDTISDSESTSAGMSPVLAANAFVVSKAASVPSQVASSSSRRACSGKLP